MSKQFEMTEQFMRAVALLGAMREAKAGKVAPNLELRLGAIYALERIARQSRDLHWPIMEILTAYVRENSPAKNAEPKSEGEAESDETVATRPPLGKDIQAILTLLARRRVQHELANTPGLDLRKSDLHGLELEKGANLARANLAEADLEGARLYGSNLQEARLWAANLQGAWLEKANLQGTELFRANLDGAQLEWANLEEAVLAGANLQGAWLTGANLQGADLEWAIFSVARLQEANLRVALLKGANLHGAWLTEANLQGADFKRATGLTAEQVREAKNWEKAINLPPEIIEELNKGEKLTTLGEAPAASGNDSSASGSPIPPSGAAPPPSIAESPPLVIESPPPAKRLRKAKKTPLTLNKPRRRRGKE